MGNALGQVVQHVPRRLGRGKHFGKRAPQKDLAGRVEPLTRFWAVSSCRLLPAPQQLFYAATCVKETWCTDDARSCKSRQLGYEKANEIGTSQKLLPAPVQSEPE